MSDVTEINDKSINIAVVDNDNCIKELTQKIDNLEREKHEIQENFNRQRGKMQQLYMGKEEENSRLEDDIKRLRVELDEAKNELCVARLVKENEIEEERRKARAEIASLNQIIHDTVEESSSTQNEVRKLQEIIQHLEGQIMKLKIEKDKDSLLSAPSHVISATKTFAKKIMGTDFEQKLAENLEDSMKKAKEDADVMRSLVIPLEAKITELTEKLRIAEEQLGSQKLSVIPRNETDSAVSPVGSFACDLCANYEAQLQAQQKTARTFENQKIILEKNIEKLKEEFAKETQFRKEMEDKWNEKKDKQKFFVAKLKKDLENNELEMVSLRKEFCALAKDLRDNISQLTYDRETINAELDAVYKENENLVGKYHKHSEDLRNECINFPNNVEDLHELLLKRHEELITSKVAKEAAEQREEMLKCEIQLLRDQNEIELNSRKNIENIVVNENNELKRLLDEKRGELLTVNRALETSREKDLKKTEELELLKTQLTEITSENERNKEMLAQQKRSMLSLQHQLDNSEKVQQDFVRLSQSLQMQLEEMRGADTEVRWQHDDDVDHCPSCKLVFKPKNKQKVHCKHCGRIFCGQCTRFVVNSGPSQRAAQVCQVCHTLLNRDTAPYFSQEPPLSPI